MIGAIAGDIIGSIYEFKNQKSTQFPLFGAGCRFTDDTVLTVALADSILRDDSFVDLMHTYFMRYPNAGYGESFYLWAMTRSIKPYNSWGNGSAMRASPVGFAYDTLEEVLEKAAESAAVTHNHEEGIKGAQATASAIFLARTGSSREQIADYVEMNFGYDLSEPLDEIREYYQFDVSCQGSVPQAIIAFLESNDYEDAVRKAISIGGDSDTIACITGGIAQAFYGGVPKEIKEQALEHLDERLRAITLEFCEKYHC